MSEAADVDSLERIEAMLRQENDCYHIADSNPALHEANPLPAKVSTTTTPNAVSFCNMGGKDELIDIVDCRYKMGIWCYDLINFCQMSNESAELAISCLDRFMFHSNHNRFSTSQPTDPKLVCTQANTAAWTNKKVYQLVAMSSMYLTVKIQEPIAFDPETVSNKLSRGTYTAIQIENMESVLLETLTWKINPPTVKAFVYQYMILIKPVLELAHDDDDDTAQNKAANTIICDSYIYDTFYDLVQRQIKLSVLDYNFISVKASEIAVCAILNACEVLNIQDTIITQIEDILLNAIEYNDNKTTADCCDSGYNKIAPLYDIRHTLYEMLLSGNVSRQPKYMSDCKKNKKITNSPRTSVGTINDVTTLQGTCLSQKDGIANNETISATTTTKKAKSIKERLLQRQVANKKLSYVNDVPKMTHNQADGIVDSFIVSPGSTLLSATVQ